MEKNALFHCIQEYTKLYVMKFNMWLLLRMQDGYVVKLIEKGEIYDKNKKRIFRYYHSCRNSV